MSAFAAQILVRLDPDAPESLQMQLCAGLRRAIRAGVLRPGNRLPSSRALAADLRISRTTAVLAYDQLIAEGVLATRAGSGTFVAAVPGPRASVPSAPRRRHASPPGMSRRGAALAAMPTIAWKLGSTPRPFRLGTPALDLLPLHAWTRLAARRLKAITLGQLDYRDPAGELPLRSAIAEHVRRVRGAACTSDQVIVVAGAQHGLELVGRLLLDPGDTAWLEEPGYPGARAALIGAGARIVPVAVDGEGLDVAAGVRRAPAARLAYVTPSHQFPLGVSMSLPRRLALLAWARRARAWIVEDDYDSGFHYGSRPMPCLQGLDADGRVIYVGTFSKTLFPALRLGYVIVPPGLSGAMARARGASGFHPPVLDQGVLADLMEAGIFERHLRRMRREYRRRLAALAEAAARHGRGLFTLRPATTGLHAIADLHGVDDEAAFREAVAHGVEVMPVSAYCFDRRRAPRRGLVLGFGGVRPELLDAGMARLAAAVRAARNRPPGGRRRALVTVDPASGAARLAP
jgi:GntR family transcriptional regulator/MocR family aminotransferase